MKERKVDVVGNLTYADTTKMGYVMDDEGKMIPGEIVVNDYSGM